MVCCAPDARGNDAGQWTVQRSAVTTDRDARCDQLDPRPRSWHWPPQRHPLRPRAFEDADGHPEWPKVAETVIEARQHIVKGACPWVSSPPVAVSGVASAMPGAVVACGGC